MVWSKQQEQSANLSFVMNAHGKQEYLTSPIYEVCKKNALEAK